MVLNERIEARSIGRMLVGFALFVLILPCAVQAKDAEPAGFVVDVKGTWVIVLGNPLGSLHQNSYVYPGQQIQASQPLAGASITIALASGTAIRRSCMKDKGMVTCGPPIAIEEEPAAQSIAARMGSAVLQLIKPEDDHRAATVARDVFGPRPAVLGLKDGRVDLRPALARIPEGSYLALLAPNHHGEAGTELPRYAAVVTSSGPVWITPETLPPGLYHLGIFSAEAKQPIGSDVVVLVASEADFSAQQKDFAEAQGVVSTWDDDIPASSVQFVLSMYLEAMAKRAFGKS